MSYLLEIATFTLQGTLSALAAGADRIELCENPFEGGTTPSYGTLKKVSQFKSIPVFPIIRPRGGDFIYSTGEKEIIREDILLCKSLQFKGVVLGALLADGNIDKPFVHELVQLAAPMEVTFHRAFDRALDPLKALEDIIDCGCKRILSSAQHPVLTDGLSLLAELVAKAGNRIVIMPGSGLNSRNLAHVAQVTKAREFHTAARMQYENKEVFSPESMREHLQYTTVNEEEIRALKGILYQL